MATQPASCVNHRRTPTRLSCSVCDAPICPKCVRSSPVGQRCPACAKPSNSLRPRGKPVHYARAIGGGLAVAVPGGVAVAMLGFGSIIAAIVVGFAVGRVVLWGTRGQTQPPFPTVAVAAVLLGLMVGFTLTYGTPVPAFGLRMLAYPMAGWFAYREVRAAS